MNSDLPKVLCSVVDRPMIHFVLDALEKAGIKRLIVVVGYEADAVRQALAERMGRAGSEIEFIEQTEQLGTGHAVQMCAKALANQTGPTIVVAGDSPLIQATSLRKLLDRLQSSEPSLLMGTLEKGDPSGLGRIVRGENGDFLSIVEHKDATEEQLKICEVNMSTYLFQTPDLLWALDQLSNDNAQGEYYLTDCVAILREAGKSVEALPVLQECESLSINNPSELKMVDEKMRAMGYA
jgi:bifunctional UDP-N-acetylglucosamine pyrophosphorylase/glucosamine-1-phosphate N-acetyltransferase/UDP-N-acetylglucosamine pyrophosphorylase